MRWARTRWLRHGSAHAAPLMPRVNHGRWIIDCPFCPAAQGWAGEDVFGCRLCRNAAAGGRPVAVTAPAGMRQAMRLLAARPDPAARNWWPGRETLEDLVGENVAHGVG